MKITSFLVNNTVEDIEVRGMTEEFKEPTDLLIYMGPMVDVNDLCGFLNYDNTVIHIEHPVVGGVYSVWFKRYAFPRLSEPPTPTILPCRNGFFGIFGSFFIVPVNQDGEFKCIEEDLETLCNALAEVLTEYENEAGGDIDSLRLPQYRALFEQRRRKEEILSTDPYFYAESFDEKLDESLYNINDIHKKLNEICEVSNTIYARMNLEQMKHFYELPLYTHYMENTDSYNTLIQKLEEMRDELVDRERSMANYILSFLQIKRTRKRETPARFFYFMQQINDLVENVKSVVPFGRNVREYKTHIKKMDSVFENVMFITLVYDFLNDRISFIDNKIKYLKELTKNERN